MQLIEIKWTSWAVRRLSQIYTYIYLHEHSHTLAEKQTDRILQTVDILKKHPGTGAIEPMLKHYKKEHRYLISGAYKIIYRQQDNIVYITDVFHTKQHPRKIKKNKNR